MTKPNSASGKKEVYSLTEEHRAQLKPWADKWIANALRCGEYAPVEVESARQAIRGLYAAANLPTPAREIFCTSPISAAIAAGVAAGVWWLRKNPEKHPGLFARALTEADLLASIPIACAHVVAAGVAAIREEPAPTSSGFVMTPE